jgi:hypothetical protein
MQLAFKDYPELVEKYHFEIPAGYSYKDEGSHEMPAEMYPILQAALAEK